MKLPAHRAGLFDRTHGPEHAEGLPGKVLSFILCPLTPPIPPMAGRGLRCTFRSMGEKGMRRFWNHSIQAVLVFCISLMLCPVTFGKVLDVPPVEQEQSQWCWAGVSASVLAYYGQDIEQCEIAEYTRTHATWHDFGPVNCCADPNQGCNYWNYNSDYTGSIEQILLNWGVGSREDPNILSKSEVKDQIDSDRPFIMRWGWASGGGHFLVGRGIEGNVVYYMDPLPGEGWKIATYDWIVSGANHTWTDTQRMTTPVEQGLMISGEWTVSPHLKCRKTCKLNGTLKIANTGTTAVPAFYVHFYLKDGPEYSPLGSASVAGIKAGASRVVKLKPPLSIDPTGMFLVAFISLNEEPQEQDEENIFVSFGPIR